MYDDIKDVGAALGSSSTTVFSNETLQNILALGTSNDQEINFTKVSPDKNGVVTVAAGAEVVLIDSSNLFQTTITPPSNAPVVIFQGKGGVVATINDSAATVPSSNQSQVDRVVVGSAGNDRIIVADAKNTQIVLGSGDSSVQTGYGVDTVHAGLGNSTIVGGNGDYSVVKLAGNATNYQVTVNNGHAIVTDLTTNKTTDISKIQYVQLDNGNAIVFAKNSLEGQIASLYRAAFGRDADAGGLDYWFDLAKGGASMKQIAGAFAASSEFANLNATDNVKFVDDLYVRTFGRHAESAGLNYWLDFLGHGGTRADLVHTFAIIAVQNIEGTAQYIEAEVVGSVNIVTGII